MSVIDSGSPPEFLRCTSLVTLVPTATQPNANDSGEIDNIAWRDIPLTGTTRLLVASWSVTNRKNALYSASVPVIGGENMSVTSNASPGSTANGHFGCSTTENGAPNLRSSSDILHNCACCTGVYNVYGEFLLRLSRHISKISR